MLNIITAEQRLQEKKGHKIVICGQSGVGKTSLARTLDPSKTLFMDLEAVTRRLKALPLMLSVLAHGKSAAILPYS